MQTFKAKQKIQGEVEYLGHSYSAVCECFFNAIDYMDYHVSKHVTPTLSPQNPLTARDLGEEPVLLAR